MSRKWASFERFELTLSADDARTGSHSGACDDDIARLRKLPYISRQLADLGVESVKNELREYGAWDDDELADHDQNLSRVLWLACSNIRDELKA